MAQTIGPKGVLRLDVFGLGHNTLNVRSGPGTNYLEQGELRRGDRLTVRECDAGRKWLHIRAESGTEGWVSADLTDIGSNVANVPIASIVPPTPKVVARTGMIAFMIQTRPRLDHERGWQQPAAAGQYVDRNHSGGRAGWHGWWPERRAKQGQAQRL